MGTLIRRLDEAFPELRPGFQKISRAGIKEVLARLEEALRDPELREPKLKMLPMVWPTTDDLQMLDTHIFALAVTLRSKKELSYKETVKLVDKRWPGLRLRIRIDALLRRAEANLSKSTNAMPGQELRRIRDIANSSQSDSKKAREFLGLHEKVRTGMLSLSQIHWERYYSLVKGSAPTIRFAGNVVITSEAAAVYAKYLEWEHEAFIAQGSNDEAAHRRVLEQPLRDWIGQHTRFDAARDPERKLALRENARVRQRRHRSGVKKTCKKV